jgi:lysyl-tRNA synthetase class 2
MSSPWWDRTVHADRAPRLRARNAMRAALRAWFGAAGFTETECRALVQSPGNETHLHPLSTTLHGVDGTPQGTAFLHTSPEFAMKKLIAAGEDRLFEFARVWRDREAGALHAREFTMLEWYRTHASLEALMADAATIVAVAARAAGSTVLSHRGQTCDPFATPERLTVTQAFAIHAGVELDATLCPDGTPRADALRAQARATGVSCRDDDSWSDVFSRILVSRVEPALGKGRLTILHDYPAPEAALARRRPDDPRFALRFELYACGVELANCFDELTDPAEQRARFEADMDLKAQLYGYRVPLDEDLLAALPAMPPTVGGALGFDRLVLLVLGAPSIADVTWTP